MKTTSHIRSTFIDYFVKNGHTHVASSPLVPRNDPTLLFASAGMVQFKDLFTGVEKRAYTRAVTSQKCLRAGGKHNDLENVGYTARHHTFFEMLGNFSFGDYFKEEAIHFAWNCVTKEFGLPKDRLLVTVYSEDEEAVLFWKKVAGLSDDRIIRISTSDNFWSAGDTGPCGPCTEIFYDHGDKVAGGPPGSDDADGDRFTEIWNLVFMQFEQLAGGKRVALPKPSIDTGMGLERLTTVLQGIHNNYEIDLFQAIISTAEDVMKIKAAGASLPSFRVIADHLRACSFLIADGVLPSNDGRGYVLRRIMRRAMRHAHVLGAKDPVMASLVPVLVEQMGVAYPELNRAEVLIAQTLQLEEERFRGMLDRGLKLLNEETKQLKAGEDLSGDVAFKLYDTFGFPVDLTQDALKAEGRGVDIEGFNAAMERQRKESRASWSGSGEAKTDHIWFEMLDKAGATDFLGYDVDQAEAMISVILNKDKVVAEATKGDEIMILANQTPFYGESGGQMGDTGVITTHNKAVVRVTDTLKKLGKLHVHVGVVEQGSIKENDTARFVVDTERRSALRQHHSATHLMHAALRQVLGSHVTQKGSLVAPDRLRFDFSHPTPMSRQEIRTIEMLVNQQIRANEPVKTCLMQPEQAIEIGAMALFGEKYGEEVRVVSMGTEGEAANEQFSLELCGGTHVHRTGDIGLFRIMSENGVSSGVRRIEAVAGQAVEKFVDRYEDLLLEACATLKAAPQDLSTKIKASLEERRRLEQELRTLRQQLLEGKAANDSQSVTASISGVSAMFVRLQDMPNQEVRSVVDKLKADVKSGVVIITNQGAEKVALVVGVTSDLTSRVSAVNLIQVGSAALGGTGGGRPDFAQGGGPNAEAIDEAFSVIQSAIADSMKK